MLLTKELLLKMYACEEGIAFCERNKLFGFDLERLREVDGDYSNFISWLNARYKSVVFDSNGNVVRIYLMDGVYSTYTYDVRGNMVKREDSNGQWFVGEYDSNNNLIKKSNSCLLGYFGIPCSMILITI